MARNVFFSFHYQRDIFRVNQIRSMPNIAGRAAAGFKDASIWEEAKLKGDAVIKKMIDNALVGTSVTVVLIGSKTANRKYINYEIQKSIERGNGIIGIRIHHLIGHNKMPDEPGLIPKIFMDAGIKTYKYSNMEDFAMRIENAAKVANR